jgi:sterol desaturase/sphingolipid hydroxylase (fatty acid hydroxylase superfamily)
VEPNYIKAAVVVAVLAMLWVLEGIAPMFSRDGAGGMKARLRHDAANIALGLINAAVVALLFAAALVLVAEWAQRERFGLLHRLEWPAWAGWLIAIVVFDLWMYGWHVANHKVPLLWRFHQVHHADSQLDASSALRFHTGGPCSRCWE